MIKSDIGFGVIEDGTYLYQTLAIGHIKIFYIFSKHPFKIIDLFSKTRCLIP